MRTSDELSLSSAGEAFPSRDVAGPMRRARLARDLSISLLLAAAYAAAAKFGLTLAFDTHGRPHGQEAMLKQIVGNLASNAIKFVGSGVNPEVRIRAEERDDWVRLWVEDNGIGIEPRYHQRIFHAFERLHDTGTYAGTGLGLAIVRKGVQRMRGRMGVESEVGRGSRFWIELRHARP